MQKNQLKTAQELIDTQRKYVQEAEANVKKFRHVEEENTKLSVELEKERKLRTTTDKLVLKLQGQLSEFSSNPVSKETQKRFELQAKLIAKSTEDVQLFNANIEVIVKQIKNFTGSLNTSLNILKNHQIERWDEIEGMVRKLVSCCHGNYAGENKAKDDRGSNDGSGINDMDTSGETKDNGDPSSDVIDINKIFGEDKDDNDYCVEANNDSGISCFDLVEFDDESEIDNDTSSFAQRKSIRKRRRSVTLEGYVVPKQTLELHPGQQDRHVEKTDDHMTKKCDDTQKGKMVLEQKQALSPKLKKDIPCKMCDKRFKNTGRFKQHMKSHTTKLTEHSQSKRKVCYTCGQFFPNKELHKLHQIEYHGVSSLENLSHTYKQFYFYI